ncbi:alpha/beta hydrolase [Mycobacterium sp. RTGN5]|uniref:alpha/beta hydrolase n=1 Tax=Mycobacterium sp. RTGN5 TaxID=3016522 RepID=UPI0029C83FDE|nr:alpha/beta hydrolase-fold protein [Mycobacterium sp. RTGN5]
MTLTHGWLLITVQIIAGAVLLAAIGRRPRRWLQIWLPVAAVTGAAAAAFVYWFIHYQGWSQDPAPVIFWVWIVCFGVAVIVLIAGWRSAGWPRRSAALLSVPLCVLCTALAVNCWVSYFPTVQSVWDRATGSEPARWIDMSTLTDMQRNGVIPTQGVVVKVTTPDTESGFSHRQEYVYLPPAWFKSSPPPQLPAVMMFGGQFGRPDDWLRSADALKTLDDFTARHGGNAPVMVFPDVGGTFSNDTECVNGPRGNAADHLIKDVVPFVVSTFGVSPKPANWGIVGWSSGGTCALMLAVMHPEVFSAIVDVDGQLGPNAGTRDQTIARLFGGDESAWAAFDPRSAIIRHGPYTGLSAWFAVSSDTSSEYRPGNTGTPPTPPAEWDTNSEDHGDIAQALCSLVSSYGIECAVVNHHASHDFQGAGFAFADALPWLAGKIGTPGVRPIPMRGAPG